MTLLPRIATPRLRLRAPQPADAATIFRVYAQDRDVAHYMVWKPHASLSDTETFVASCIAAWRDGARRPYVITLAGDDSAIGMLEARPLGSTLDIGYVLARRCWGNGYMPEVIDEFAKQTLAEPNVFRIQATCDVDNVASQRALEKSSFLREGRLERLTVHPNISPEPRPCFMYARCR